MSNLYVHQEVGAAWLAARPRAYLGDKPGTGKTRTLLAAAKAASRRLPLVVCPAIVRSHWRAEAAVLGMHNVIVKSYDEIRIGGNALMKALVPQIDALILDEAHYLKNGTSERTKQLLGRDGYVRRVPYVWAASGTPVPKNPAEFWTVLASMFPNVARDMNLRTYADFVDRFCHVQWNKRTLSYTPVNGAMRHAAEFKSMLNLIMLTRTLDDVGADVPELDVQVMRLDGGKLDAETARAFDVLLGNKSLEDEHIATARRVVGEAKAKLVANLLKKELEDSDESIVVFAHHRSVMAALHTHLQPFGVSVIDGDVTTAQRDYAIADFQAGRTRVFLGQNIACQTGITLTQASRVILVEPDWTATTNLQLAHRVRRIGQKAERCTVQMVALAGTLDEAIVQQNARETRMLVALDERETKAA